MSLPLSLALCWPLGKTVEQNKDLRTGDEWEVLLVKSFVYLVRQKKKKFSAQKCKVHNGTEDFGCFINKIKK